MTKKQRKEMDSVHQEWANTANAPTIIKNHKGKTIKIFRPKLKILFKRISPKHEDSFWYGGVLAVKGKAEMIANGEIDLRHETRQFRCNGRSSWDEETKLELTLLDTRKHNDKTLEKMITKQGYYFDMNNWFEVFDDKDAQDGIVCDTYSEALKVLKSL